MRSKNDEGPLGEILHNIALAEQFTGGLSFDDFRIDLMRVYATVRCLEIISEASRRLSDDLKVRHPHIPWREMAGAGNIYRHDYEDVAATRIWDTVVRALPPLRAAVEQELGESLSTTSDRRQRHRVAVLACHIFDNVRMRRALGLIKSCK